MGKVIVVGLVIVTLALIIAAVAVYFRRRQSKETALERGWATKGDLNRRQEQQLLAAVSIAESLFRQFLAPPVDLSGEMTLLTHADRRRAEEWLQEYASTTNTRRVIERS